MVLRRVVFACELFSRKTAMQQPSNPSLANLYGSILFTIILTLIGSVLMPLRVTDGKFRKGALLLETKVSIKYL